MFKKIVSYVTRIMPFLAQQKENLVLFDESHFISEDMWKQNGWYSVGAAAPAFDQGIFNQQSLSLLLAIDYNGRVLHHIHRHERSQGVEDTVFLMLLLRAHQNTPLNKIFVLDNAPAHRSYLAESIVKKMIEDGRLVVFQAKYSPDCNPIEYIFGILKRRAKNTEQIPKDLFQHVEDLVLALDDDEDNACKNTINKVFNF